MTFYSWKCDECKIKGNRWFKKWYGTPLSPFNSAGLHTSICKKNRENKHRYGGHPHASCPNHLIVSKEVTI